MRDLRPFMKQASCSPAPGTDKIVSRLLATPNLFKFWVLFSSLTPYAHWPDQLGDRYTTVSTEDVRLALVLPDDDG